MKNLKLVLLLVLSPLSFFGQALSGLWMGTLNNDSNSVRKDQSFEIVLSQYKQKVYGYSRNTFIVNDTLYYIVKRVKGTIIGDVCEVKDDHVVSHNFPKKPEKGVKVISTFHRNKQDSTWYLAGDWKTTKTKTYYSVSGKVELKEEKDLSVSKIYPHLEELGLQEDVPVFAALNKEKSQSQSNPTPKKSDPPIAKKNETVNPGKNEELSKPVAVNAKKQDIQTNKTTSNSKEEKETEKLQNTIAKNEVRNEPTVVLTNPAKEVTVATKTPENPTQPKQNSHNTETAKTEVVVQKPQTQATSPQVAAKNQNNQSTPNTATITKPVQVAPNDNSKLSNNNTTVSTNSRPVQQLKTVPPTQTGSASGQPTTSKTAANDKAVNQQQKEPATNAIATSKKQDPNTLITAPVQRPDVSSLPMTKPLTPAIPAAVAERKTEAPQFVEYVSDSLVLILYDNGEVDGDTVSVFMNGQMLMEKQGLKTAAIRKTIYITPGNEELTLLLFAENLGKYPPNTGLLIVYDGETRHQLRFSADFEKNASVLFKRKKD